MSNNNSPAKMGNMDDSICVEGWQSRLGLSFVSKVSTSIFPAKQTVVKPVRPISAQIQVYSEEDQSKGECRL